MGYIFTVVTLRLLPAIETIGLLRAIETMGLPRAIASMGLLRAVYRLAKHGPIMDRIMGHKRARVGTVRSWADHNGASLIGRI